MRRQKTHLKMLCDEVVCCKNCLTLLTHLSMETNGVDTDQMASTKLYSLLIYFSRRQNQTNSFVIWAGEKIISEKPWKRLYSSFEYA